MSWTVQLPSPLTASPTVAGGSVFVATDGALHCLDATQGSTLWNHPETLGGFTGRPIVMGDRVLAWAGKLLVLDRNTGMEAWSETTQDSFCVLGGQVAYRSGNGFKIKALDKGQELWLGDVGNGKAVTTLSCAGNQIFVLYTRVPPDGSSTPAGLQAWDLSERRILWDSELAQVPIYPPVVGEDQVYLVVAKPGHGELLGLDRKNGQVKWTVATDPFKTSAQAPAPYLSIPATDGTAVLFTVRDGSGHSLQSLLPDTGQRLWRFVIDWPVYAAGSNVPSMTGPVLGRQSVVVGAGNRLARVDLHSGKLRSAFEADSFIRAEPVLGEDGTAYFGTASGRFYATK